MYIYIYIYICGNKGWQTVGTNACEHKRRLFIASREKEFFGECRVTILYYSIAYYTTLSYNILIGGLFGKGRRARSRAGQARKVRHCIHLD